MTNRGNPFHSQAVSNVFILKSKVLFTIVLQGTCVDKVNGFDCFCETGFSGIRCEVDVNDCLLVSCGNGEAYRSLNVHLMHFM